jgi:isoquinoline 1-oxidoreductase alpha subunit
VRFTLTVNGSPETVDAEPDAPLLWVLRDHIGLTGTKFGCGLGICRACTVHIDGERALSCQTAISDAAGGAVTTIEGLAAMRHALLDAWVEEQVPQCGYCQPGMIMSAADLLARNKQPSREAIVAHMQNICRCGTYPRVIRAIQRVAAGSA